MKRFLLSILFIYVSQGRSEAQVTTNYSGLRNAELTKCAGSSEQIREDIKKDLPGQGLPAWGADRMKQKAGMSNPQIDRVAILEDRAQEVKGEIYFSGLEAGKMKVSVQNRNGDEQSEVPAVMIPVDGASGMLSFDLKLSPNFAENTYLRSLFIRLSFSGNSNPNPRTFCFNFPKGWRKVPDNERIVVTVRPEPFKTAAQITTWSPTLPLPSAGGTASASATGMTTRVGQTPPPVAFAQAQGPAANPMQSFYEEILRDYDFSGPKDLSDIALDQIFPDKNDTSGVYYYKPSAYSLNWTPDEGFRMTMLYGVNSGNGQGQVNMSAALSSNLTSNEYDFVKNMLESYLKTRKKNFASLDALVPDEPKVSIRDKLASFNIPADKTSATVSSSIYDPIDVSWIADKDAADFMITAMAENKDIGGELSYHAGEGGRNYTVPVTIRLADKSTFGRFELSPGSWRTNNWRNQTPYAVKLKNMHVLMMNLVQGLAKPCVYTWTLGGKTIPSHAQVKFDPVQVPTWIDDPGKVLRIWMDYDVVPCPECTQEIVDQISSGVSSGRQKNITFHSMGLLETYGASYLKVRIRSRNLDPRGKVTKEKIITIDHDKKNFEASPFYSWDDKDLRYEYKLIFITEEKTYEGNNWIPSTDTEVYLNKATAQKSMGTGLPPAK